MNKHIYKYMSLENETKKCFHVEMEHFIPHNE